MILIILLEKFSTNLKANTCVFTVYLQEFHIPFTLARYDRGTGI